METSCTGVILAGGKNSRMAGENKAFMSVGDQRVVDRIINRYRSFFDEIILVTNDPDEYCDLDVKIVTDIYKKKCSLAGIHAGLFYSSNPWIFVTPCDLPFLTEEMVRLILDHVHTGFNVLIPETSKGMEPLCAMYSKENLPSIEQCLIHDRLKIQSFFKPKRVRKISEKKLRHADPDLISFFNVNTPDDLEQANSMIKTKVEA